MYFNVKDLIEKLNQIIRLMTIVADIGNIKATTPNIQWNNILKYSSNFIYNSAVQPTKLIHTTFPPHWQLLRFRDCKYVIGVHAINQRLANELFAGPSVFPRSASPRGSGMHVRDQNGY